MIAQVHGYALAGGLELAMACDLIVASDDARLGEPEIRFGSAPVTLLMPFLIGQKKTRELLMTGDLIDAREAERIGLVNRVVPAERTSPPRSTPWPIGSPASRRTSWRRRS